MSIRTFVATGLCMSILTAGCASVVAGQAEIVSGAVLPTTSQSAPSPFPDPSSTGSMGGGSTSSDSFSSGTTGQDPTSDGDTTALTENPPTTTSSSAAEDDPDGPTSATSIPGPSKDCNAVLAGITAFSLLLRGGGSSDRISQAMVDKALAQLPESGLPARPQADITVLRGVVAGAVGKTASQLSLGLADGNVLAALEDLSSWAQDNCT